LTFTGEKTNVQQNTNRKNKYDPLQKQT